MTGARILASLFGLVVLAACNAPTSQQAAKSAEPRTPIERETAAVAALPSTAQALRPLADRGNADAQYKLGWLHAEGRGGAAKSPAQALAWYTKAADAGHSFAQNSLGLMYQNGIGTTQNYAEALTLFRKSAAQGNVSAENNIGVAYAQGRGVAADPKAASAWYLKAAGKGNATAQINIAGFYSDGYGVKQSDTDAYFWYVLGSSKFTGEQATKIATSRDAVAKRLAPETVVEIQRLAREWKPGADTARLAAIAATSVGSGAALGNGTGFFVSRAGHVLTNAHVVRSCRKVSVKPAGRAAAEVEVVALDEANDLALLKTGATGIEPAAFRRDRAIRQGDGIVAFGYPLQQTLATDGNLTTGTVTALAGIKNDSRMLQVSAPIQPGNSGGPLADLSGHVVGVVVSKLNALRVAQATGDVPQNVNFAIKASVARGFLEANGIEFATAASGPDLKPADVGEKVRRFTARVDCRG